MSNNLSQEKIVILAANGFNQYEMTSMQRALQSIGISARVVAMGNTLIQGWSGSGWGHSFAADQLLNEALAADFTMLIVPGGKRSIETLKATAHTKRFLRGFMDMGKKVVMFSDAVELLAFCECASGRVVSGSTDLKADLNQAGAQWQDNPVTIDGSLITVRGDDLEEEIDLVMSELGGFTPLQKAA